MRGAEVGDIGLGIVDVVGGEAVDAEKDDDAVIHRREGIGGGTERGGKVGRGKEQNRKMRYGGGGRIGTT